MFADFSPRKRALPPSFDFSKNSVKFCRSAGARGEDLDPGSRRRGRGRRSSSRIWSTRAAVLFGAEVRQLSRGEAPVAGHLAHAGHGGRDRPENVRQFTEGCHRPASWRAHCRRIRRDRGCQIRPPPDDVLATTVVGALVNEAFPFPPKLPIQERSLAGHPQGPRRNSSPVQKELLIWCPCSTRSAEQT